MGTAFCVLSKQALQELSDSKRELQFKKGEMIFSEGSVPNGLYCVSKGIVKLETTSARGDGHILRLIKAGDVLGYRSLFANESYSANAIAVEPVEACLIPREKIQDLCQRHPELALQFLKSVSSELRRSEERLVAAIDKDATERVAEAILFLKDNFSSPIWTRREIAEWAGTTPETVMRTLAALEDQGLIEQEGRKIEIVDKQRLLDLANLAL